MFFALGARRGGNNPSSSSLIDEGPPFGLRLMAFSLLLLFLPCLPPPDGSETRSMQRLLLCRKKSSILPRRITYKNSQDEQACNFWSFPSFESFSLQAKFKVSPCTVFVLNGVLDFPRDKRLSNRLISWDFALLLLPWDVTSAKGGKNTGHGCSYIFFTHVRWELPNG